MNSDTLRKSIGIHNGNPYHCVISLWRSQHLLSHSYFYWYHYFFICVILLVQFCTIFCVCHFLFLTFRSQGICPPTQEWFVVDGGKLTSSLGRSLSSGLLLTCRFPVEDSGSLFFVLSSSAYQPTLLGVTLIPSAPDFTS